MRREFIQCQSRITATGKCPWAAIIVKVEGGYQAFESMTDYCTWKSQQ
jgi:hypothetical protein